VEREKRSRSCRLRRRTVAAADAMEALSVPQREAK
jgi:hypothetical protein